MRLNEAVHSVTGEVFRDGWSRIRGSMQGLHVSKQKQLLRAASGHRPAVFKAIRSGGTHTKAQLMSQLDYLTTKSSHIVDSRGVLDGKSRLEKSEIKELTERFAKRWEGGFKPTLGQTTHLLMSFPIGTRGEDVRDIASDVAERFFQADEGHFDYIIAVHEDRDHPHAHLVLNRRSQEGEFFYLGRDHRFNYDAFRLAMVEEAEKYGVRLEATRRVDRGLVHYPPRTREVYAAKDDGRAPVERERVGQDLIRTLAEIANTRIVYHSLAAEASQENREDIADALFRAGEMLVRGGQLETSGDVYMAGEQSFDDLRSLYAEKLERVQGMIAEKSDAERPALEKSLVAIQARVAHMQPLGLRSHTLSEAPSEGGVYSEANIETGQLGRLAEPRLRSRIDTALRGTGISTSEVVVRMEAGASSATLEHQWIADDLSKVAEARDFNLERRKDLEQARDILNDGHVKLGTLLEKEGILRKDGITDAPRAAQIARDVDRIMEGRDIKVPVAEVVAEDFRERYPDMPSHLARGLGATYGAVVQLHERDAIHAVQRDAVPMALDDRAASRAAARDVEQDIRGVDTPELERVLAHERAGELSSPFKGPADRAAFRDEIARVLDEAQRDRLTSGDADALEKVLEDRLDRLYVAKVYLQSDAATANSVALRQVVDDLAEAEYEKHCAADIEGEIDRGQTH